MKKFNSIIPFITLLLMILVTLATSCDKRNPPVIIPPIPDPPPASALREITKIYADRDTIYADNNYTYAHISVMVKDGEGYAVPNQLVNFKCDIGKLLTNVYTDSTGVATTTFWDNNDLGAVSIEATVRNYSTVVEDSILSEVKVTYNNIRIIPVPDVASIDFWELPVQGGNKYLALSVMQNVTVRARIRDAQGNDVPDNTLITFQTDKGDFLDNAGNIVGDRAIVKTYNGRASAYYAAGSSAGTGAITASVHEDGLPLAMDTAILILAPGRPAMIQLKAYVRPPGEDETEAYSNPVNSPNDIIMRASLRDAYSNYCPSTPVKFATNLGTFVNTTQQTFANTSPEGFAEVLFTPGLAAGGATITASANGDTLSTQIIFNVQSDGIHSITFTQAGQIDLNVANTGGTSSAVLRVQLKDINGNLIDISKPVSFKILTNDIDANLNNQPTNATVTVNSTGGEAQVSVNSGFLSGTITIRATCEDNGVTVQATKSNIVVSSGPPHTIQPFISGFDSGINVGGGLWRIVAGAIVRDVYNNPVDYGTSVFFSIPFNPYNVQIVANAYSGNASVNGDSLAGVAYTKLTYSGMNTFDEIVIEARSGSFTPSGEYVSVYGYSAVILPLNQPIIEAQAVPWHLDFSEQATWTNITSLVAEVWVSLIDSQGNLIHGADILLSSPRGNFIYCDPWAMDFNFPNHNFPANDYHIIQTGLAGMSRGKIRLWRHECPPPDPTGLPGNATADITVRLLGTSTADQTSVIIWRYVELPYPPPNPPPLG